MSNHSTEIKVGIAVSLGIVLLIFTIFMLGQDSSLFARTYRLHVAFSKIDGLAPGSVVRLSGLRVGNVEKIDFHEKENKLMATLKIELKYQSKITENSTADLKTQGALGDKYVSIEPGEPGGKTLSDEAWISSKQGGDFLTALSTRGNELEKIFDILNELHLFAKNLNHDNRSGKVMENLVTSTENLNRLLKDLRGDEKANMKKAIAHLSSILEKIDNGDGTLGALINDPSLHEKIKSLVGASPKNQYMKSAIQKTIQEGTK